MRWRVARQLRAIYPALASRACLRQPQATLRCEVRTQKGSGQLPFERLLSAQLLFVRHFRGVLFLRILVAVACRTQRQEDQREHCEDEGLNEGDEDFEEVERYRANEWQQETDDQ